MAIEWADSAEKHYPIEDALHAIRNRRAFVQDFDRSPSTGDPVDLVIGPARDGQQLEVFVHRRIPRTTYVFHVLHLRRKTWDRAKTIIDGRE